MMHQMPRDPRRPQQARPMAAAAPVLPASRTQPAAAEAFVARPVLDDIFPDEEKECARPAHSAAPILPPAPRPTAIDLRFEDPPASHTSLVSPPRARPSLQVPESPAVPYSSAESPTTSSARPSYQSTMHRSSHPPSSKPLKRQASQQSAGSNSASSSGITEGELSKLAEPLMIASTTPLIPSHCAELGIALETFIRKAREPIGVDTRKHALGLIRRVTHPVLRTAIIGSGAFSMTLNRWLNQFHAKKEDGMLKYFLQFCADVVPDITALVRHIPPTIRPAIPAFLFSSRGSRTPYDPSVEFATFISSCAKLAGDPNKAGLTAEERGLLERAIGNWQAMEKQSEEWWRQCVQLMPASEEEAAASTAAATAALPGASPLSSVDEDESMEGATTPTGKPKSFSNLNPLKIDVQLGHQEHHGPAKISTNAAAAAAADVDRDPSPLPGLAATPTSRKRKSIAIVESKNEHAACTWTREGAPSILRVSVGVGREREMIRHPRWNDATMPAAIAKLPFADFFAHIAGKRGEMKLTRETRELILGGRIPPLSLLLSNLHQPRQQDSVLLSAVQEIQLLLVREQSQWLPHWVLFIYHIQRLIQTCYHATGPDGELERDLAPVQAYWRTVEDKKWSDQQVQERELNYDEIEAMAHSASDAADASSASSSSGSHREVDMQLEEPRAAAADSSSHAPMTDVAAAAPPQSTGSTSSMPTMNVLEELPEYAFPQPMMNTQYIPPPPPPPPPSQASMRVTTPVPTSNTAPPVFDFTPAATPSENDAPRAKRTKRPTVSVGSAMASTPAPPQPPAAVMTLPLMPPTPPSSTTSDVPSALPAPPTSIFTSPPLTTAHTARAPSPVTSILQVRSPPPVSTGQSTHPPPRLVTGSSPVSSAMTSFTSPPASPHVPSYRSSTTSSSSSSRAPHRTPDLRRHTSIETAAGDNRGMLSPRSTGSGGSSSGNGSRAGGGASASGHSAGSASSASNSLGSNGGDDAFMSDAAPANQRSLSPQPLHNPATVYSKPFIPGYQRSTGRPVQRAIDPTVCSGFNSPQGCPLLSHDAPAPREHRGAELRRCTRRHLCHFQDCRTRFSQPHAAMNCPHSADTPRINTSNGSAGRARY